MKDSLWFFQKISLGLALVNGILLAMADNKLTIDEIVSLINTAIAGFAPDMKISVDDIQIEYTDDKALVITLEPELVNKFSIGL